jgi:hypothetical protein
VPDDFDRAQDAAELITQDALERQRILATKTKHFAAQGECLNPHCAEPFAANDNARLYCGPAREAEHRRLRRVS